VTVSTVRVLLAKGIGFWLAFTIRAFKRCRRFIFLSLRGWLARIFIIFFGRSFKKYGNEIVLSIFWVFYTLRARSVASVIARLRSA
jgi:hypothetical protein